MELYRQVFVTALHEKLKAKIKGGILVKVDRNDVLIVEIFRDHELDYQYTLDNFSTRFLYGLNSEYIAYEVVTGYKKRVLAKHFY